MRHQFFKFLAEISSKRPRLIVTLAIILTLASGIYAAMTIQLNADLDDLVSEKLEYHKRYKDFLKEFGDQEYLYVVVEIAGDLPRAKQFTTDLAARLSKIPDVKDLIYKVDNPAMERGFMLYLPLPDLRALKAMLTKGAFDVRNVAQWQSMVPFFKAINDEVAGPVDTAREKELATSFTFLDGIIGNMGDMLGKGAPYQSQLQALFFGDGETFDPDGFLKNGDLLFCLIMPKKDFTTMAVIAEPLAKIRAAIDETKKEYPGLRAGLTGRPVLAADELSTSNRDSTKATILAIVLVGIIFIAFFRSFARPLIAMISLVMGIAWTFGFVAVVYGELTILSVVFAMILVGSSIEYAIHLVARYQEGLSKGETPEHAMFTTLYTAGRSDLTSAFTTAGAFFTITWTDFTALAQLGVIAGTGVILCLLAMLIALPAMLILRDRNIAPAKLKAVRPFGIPRIARLYAHPKRLLIGCGIVTAALIPFVLRTNFDNNLLNLQAKGLESVELEHLIIEKSSETTWFANSVANSVADSHEKAALLRKLPSVRRVDDIERIVPEQQDEKSALVRAMAPAFAQLHFAPPSDTLDVPALIAELDRLEKGVGRLTEEAFSAGRVDAVEELEKFSRKVATLKSLATTLDTTGYASLVEFQKKFLGDMHANLKILATGMDPKPITLADIPESIAQRFVGKTGKYALTVYPKENIWDPEKLKVFVDDLRSVDLASVGTPIEVHESGRLMRDTFLKSAILAFIAISLMVIIDFKKARPSAMAIMPLVLGTFWLLGFMGIFRIPFNMANFFAIPILIGIGVDNGVHLVHRMLRDGNVMSVGESTGKGVLLTAISNIIGFGAMMIAAHRGIASLGQIMAIGGLTLVLAALLAMPPMAHWVMKMPIEKK